MIFEDVVECEGCGAKITHLCCGRIDIKNDPDYYICQSCIDERDVQVDDDSQRYSDAVEVHPQAGRYF